MSILHNFDSISNPLDDDGDDGPATQLCTVCGKLFFGHSNNPEPVADDSCCCDRCNREVVYPTRCKEARRREWH